MTRIHELGRGGDSARRYTPTPNLNRLINDLVTKPRYAFPGLSALILQQKKFPDLSFYQGVINFQFLRQKTDTAVFRAGQNLWVDTQFVTNYAKAKAQGMLRGVYWFYDDRVSPGAQAEKLCELIKDDLPEMEVWADWERSYGGKFGGLKNVVAFMEAIERTLPVKVGMYTGYWWFVENSNALRNASQYNYLKNKPLWLAWYAAASAVKVPAPWTKLDLWQYGTPDEYWGQVSIEIDMNFYNGTIAEFYQRYSLEVVAEPTGEQGMYRGTTPVNIDVWDEPGGSKVGIIRAGSTVSGDDPVSDWVRLNHQINGHNVYTKRALLGSWYQRVVVTPPPPPSEDPTITLKHTIKIYRDGSYQVDDGPRIP